MRGEAVSGGVWERPGIQGFSISCSGTKVRRYMECFQKRGKLGMGGCKPGSVNSVVEAPANRALRTGLCSPPRRRIHKNYQRSLAAGGLPCSGSVRHAGSEREVWLPSPTATAGLFPVALSIGRQHHLRHHMLRRLPRFCDTHALQVLRT